MRKVFAAEIMAMAEDPELFLLTGDVGFMALEEVRSRLGDRFINCGIAEQNMVAVAAGLARRGSRVFVYSIAPFCYARPFEQIRNDLAMTGLPVCLVGNGGGYAYGHMGPTHHALEDCAAMGALGLRTGIPAFDEDVAPVLNSLRNGPAYLRLGYDARPPGSAAPEYAPCRLVLPGKKGILAALGPLAGLAWKALADMASESRPAVWAFTELPLPALPEDFLAALASTSRLHVVEEHVKQGGLGMQLLYEASRLGIGPREFTHRFALGYPSKRYGSQDFHRAECGMDAAAIRKLAESGSH